MKNNMTVRTKYIYNQGQIRILAKIHVCKEESSMKRKLNYRFFVIDVVLVPDDIDGHLGSNKNCLYLENHVKIDFIVI